MEIILGICLAYITILIRQYAIIDLSMHNMDLARTDKFVWRLYYIY